MSCKIKIRRHGKVPVIGLAGELSGGESTAKVLKKLTDHAHDDAKTVAVDLSETAFIDSNGLGMLVYAWKTLKEAECRLVFFDPSPLVRSILQNTNLTGVFTIIDSLDTL